MDLLNASFGSGGMTCGMDQNQLPSFVQHLKRESGSRLPTKYAVFRPGRQEDDLYFLNEEVTVDGDGKQIEFSESDYVWLRKEAIYDSDKMLMSDIMPMIKTPLTSSVLEPLMKKLQVCLKHNFIPGLLVVAGATMSFHYQQIVVDAV